MGMDFSGIAIAIILTLANIFVVTCFLIYWSFSKKFTLKNKKNIAIIILTIIILQILSILLSAIVNEFIFSRGLISKTTNLIIGYALIPFIIIGYLYIQKKHLR